MPDEIDRPLLNPVLQLNMESRREAPPGGGKSRNTVVTARLPFQQRVLSSAARELYRTRDNLQTYGGFARALLHSGRPLLERNRMSARRALPARLRGGGERFSAACA